MEDYFKIVVIHRGTSWDIVGLHGLGHPVDHRGTSTWTTGGHRGTSTCTTGGRHRGTSTWITGGRHRGTSTWTTGVRHRGTSTWITGETTSWDFDLDHWGDDIVELQPEPPGRQHRRTFRLDYRRTTPRDFNLMASLDFQLRRFRPRIRQDFNLDYRTGLQSVSSSLCSNMDHHWTLMWDIVDFQFYIATIRWTSASFTFCIFVNLLHDRCGAFGGGRRGTSSDSGQRRTSSDGYGEQRGTSSDGEQRGTSSDGEQRGTSSDGGQRETSSDGGQRGTSSDGGQRGTSSDGGQRGISLDDGRRTTWDFFGG